MTLSKAKAAEAAKMPPHKPTVNALNALVRSLEPLNERTATLASIGRQLARRIDTPTTGSTSLALLVRELLFVVDALPDAEQSAHVADLVRSRSHYGRDDGRERRRRLLKAEQEGAA